MAHAKVPVPWFPDAEFRRESDEMTGIFAEAVAQTREENRRLGIPNIQVDDQGRLTEELPDGSTRLLQTVTPASDSPAK
jgi:hypothetical protein